MQTSNTFYTFYTSSFDIHKEAPYIMFKTWNARHWSSYKWKQIPHVVLFARDYSLCVERKWYPLCHVTNPTKPVQSRGVDLLCLFFACLWTLTASQSTNMQKEVGQYPAILTKLGQTLVPPGLHGQVFQVHSNHIAYNQYTVNRFKG